MSDVTKIQNPSITPKDFTIQDNKIIAISGIPVSGAGGTTSDYVYYPSYDDTTGDITFTLGTIQSHQEPYGPYHISGAQGEQGASGYTPEFRINSDKEDHWEWRYTEGGDWHDLGIAASGIEGPRGPQGEPGQNGKSVSASVSPIEGGVGYIITLKDGISTTDFNLYSPSVSTAVIPSGNRVTFSYAGTHSTYIDVMSGTKGDTGTSGISPVITTATIGAQEGHPQGGTEVTVTDIDHPDGQSFTVWNGINGQGATVELKGGNGIQVTNEGNDYTIEVSANYATQAYAEEASAAAYNKAHAEIPSLTDYYHKSETSGANEITTALAQKLDIEALPNYDGENGIYVDDSNHIIGISADYKAQIEAVSGKLTPPTATTQYGEQYIWSTVPTASGWMNIDNWFSNQDVLGHSEIPDVFKSENGISANYSNNIFTFGLSAEYENAIKTVSGKVDKPGAGSTGIQVYNATYLSWEPFKLVLPINIGNNNTVTNDSIGVIGNNSYAGVKSMAISYTGATAISNSMAFGDGNYASANSMAAGWGVKAKDYSVIFGHGTTNDPSEVKNYSFAAGDAVFAYNYSQAFGRGLIASGNPNGKGCMVIGGWNKTSADALFVIGNGTNSDTAHRNDLLVAYANGSIVVGNGNNVTQSNSYVEGLNHTVTPTGATSYGHGYNHIEGAYNTANGGLYNHIEGEANAVYGDRIHMEGSRNIFSAGEGGNTWGISIEGVLNSTTANVTEHGGLLKVIGNGVYTDSTHQTRSDASILYRDGTWKATDYETFTGNNKLSEKVSYKENTAHPLELPQQMVVVNSDTELVNMLGDLSGKGTIFFVVQNHS